jgi:diacylglycerol kinase family enzyme
VIDVGRVTSDLYPKGRYFGNGVGIGFDAVVGFEALKLPPGLNGFLAYTLAALKTIFLFDKPPLMKVDTDGETFERRCLMVSIMNGKRMGGGFMMAPQGQTGDGKLDLCIAGQVTRLGILGLIPRFMKGNQAGHPAIEFRQGRHIRVNALEGALPAHADGETLCVEGKQVEIELIPQALEVVVPGPQMAL